jgi:hypothetical protein
MTTTFLRLILLTVSTTLAAQVFAQVQTDAPPVVPNAKPVTVESSSANISVSSRDVAKANPTSTISAGQLFVLLVLS